MIKFNCLIHKETGTVIKYLDWLEEVKKQPGITDQPVEKEISQGIILNYRPKQALFSDNFEIIYDSEFTTEEKEILIDGLKTVLDIDTGEKELTGYYELIDKINNRIEV